MTLTTGAALVEVTPEQARRLAARLLVAADLADTNAVDLGELC